MKFQTKVLSSAVVMAGLMFSGAALAEEDPLAACVAGVKANTPADQYTEEGATAFCGCVGEKAAADEALAAELESVRGKSPEEAEAALSDGANAAIQACIPA